MARPTTSMKEGWLCRTSYDKIAHMMMTRWDPDRAMIQIQLWWLWEIQIEWWSRSSSDDPDPAVMIQIEWWSRSNSDDPDPVVMIQIQQWWSRSSDDVQLWWSRLSDDLDPMMMSSYDDLDRVMIQIQWWWSRLSDDPDPEKNMAWR